VYFHWYCLTKRVVIRGLYLQEGCFEGSQQSIGWLLLIDFSWTK